MERSAKLFVWADYLQDNLEKCKMFMLQRLTNGNSLYDGFLNFELINAHKPECNINLDKRHHSLPLSFPCWFHSHVGNTFRMERFRRHATQNHKALLAN